MGRKGFFVYIGRFFQKFPFRWFRFIEKAFLFFSSKGKKPRALFLLALPRSGSTLSYQVVVHGVRVQYLSNLSHMLYQLPLFGGWLGKWLAVKHQSNFQSYHGFIEGLAGPAEGMHFWKWWLDCGLSDKDCYNLPDKVRDNRTEYLKSAWRILTRNKMPYMSAYLGHVLVPDRLYRAFNDAVFIRLRRNPVDNAMSMLKAMRKSGEKWFSVVPEECLEYADSGEHMRVASQVYWLNRRLDESMVARECLIINYEDLCRSPKNVLDHIVKYSEEKGIMLTKKFDLPKNFPFKNSDTKNDFDAKAIEAALSELERRHGQSQNGL